MNFSSLAFALRSLVTVYKLASSPTEALREGVKKLSSGVLEAAAYRAEEAAIKEQEKVREARCPIAQRRGFPPPPVS